MTDSDLSEISSTSDVNYSDIDFDTPNTTDMKFSDVSDYPCDESSVGNISFEKKKKLGVRSLDQDSPSSFSENELDAVSLSSYVTSYGNTSQYDTKCAVILCNSNARNQFDKLFFINFPRDNKSLCEIWWRLCGHHGLFNPSSKICSIHFKADDFTSNMVRRDGKLYRQTILKNNYIVPTLYLQPYEYAKFTRKRKKRVNGISKHKKSKSIDVCVIQGCKKTSFKNGKTTLFFKFPLENKFLLKKWLNNIGLPYWKPLKTNRICSDHFESYYIVKIDGVYQLKKYAVPSIKAKNLFVMNHTNNNNGKFKTSVNDPISPSDFNRLEFNMVDKNTLVVEEKKRKNGNIRKTNLLTSLERKINQQLKKYDKILEATSLTNSPVLQDSDKEEHFLTKCNKTNVEETLDDVNNFKELQSTKKTNLSLTKQYLESFEKEIAKERENINGNLNSNDIDLEYVYLDILNDVNMNASGVMEVQPTCDTNNSLNVKNNTDELEFETSKNGLNSMSVESMKENILFEEKEEMNKISNNNDIDLEYVYMGMLNDESMMGVQPIYDTNLSIKDESNVTETVFETNKNNSKNTIVESPVLKIAEEIPDSIIYDQVLSECYGEMLPPYCDQNCQLKCYYSVPGPQRREIFNEFNKLQNVIEQNCKIAQLVQLVMVENIESNFERFVTYHLTMNKESVKVCQLFFINTLGISEHRLDAILKPVNYNWYINSDAALKANVPKEATTINEQIIITNFVKESLKLLDKDYNLYVPESDTEIDLENVPSQEQEKVLMYIKSIPRILCVPKFPGDVKKQLFETSICMGYMYKTYSENYIKNKIPPPYTKRQFKKIYNLYMKSHLKMV
ncbi:uncharacterized protein LOC114125885 isoform X1 [Aphis gossypii]|uniref:uncharacterized protein LOC114125885 isoform X1 n=1 Tax=Aphis gossypii TaxID=80765 RepID=UPI0021597BDE|nr:uncharacterized protein LOC114125885 isoform X1 [Aphis gossypii]